MNQFKKTWNKFGFIFDSFVFFFFFFFSSFVFNESNIKPNLFHFRYAVYPCFHHLQFPSVCVDNDCNFKKQWLSFGLHVQVEPFLWNLSIKPTKRQRVHRQLQLKHCELIINKTRKRLKTNHALLSSKRRVANVTDRQMKSPWLANKEIETSWTNLSHMYYGAS